MICFHCGEPGHRAAACPSRVDIDIHSSNTVAPPQIGGDSSKQTAAGQEAFRRHLRTRRELAAKNDGQALHTTTCCYSGSSCKKKGPSYNLDKVVQWMQDDARTGPGLLKDTIINPTNPNNNLNPHAIDPMALLLLQAQEKKHATNNNNNGNTQRWRDLHNAKRNNLEHAHRESFHRVMDNVRQSLAMKLNVTPSDEASSTWQAELTRAVELGRPANFSVNHDYNNSIGLDEKDDSGRCLRVYAVEKLQARCRQLHHLVFGDDVFASRVRSMLLPIPISSSLGSASALASAAALCNGVEETGVNIISIGGGPGYDHVAMCLASKFLHDIQPQRKVMKQRQITTRVFDLFDKDWEPVMVCLGECLHQSLSQDEIERRKDDGNCDAVNNGSNMTMHHADIRLRLEDACNNDLGRALEVVDIICVQFCLHENASFIVKDAENSEQDEQQQHNQRRICGVMGDIFEKAPIGTIMIVTDSANTLFPPLKTTAQSCGWKYLGDDEKRGSGTKLAYLGPKSFVMLERIKIT